MSGRKQSRGACVFCGRELTKIGLVRHLKSCRARQQAIDEAAKKRRTGQAQQLFHLLVQDARDPDFWLHLEMNRRASLEELDYYLRAIWLECCGHPSQFLVRGRSDDKIPMFWSIDRILEPGVVLTHIYDFGTSSETLVKLVDTRAGQPLQGLLIARTRKLCSGCS